MTILPRLSRFPTWATADESVVLVCGDAREVLPLLEGVGVDAVITDPPYGVNLGDHHGAAECRSGWLTKGNYESYEDTPENFRQVVRPVIEQALAIAARGMVFAVPPTAWMLPAPNAIGGFYVSAAMGRNKWGFSSFIPCLLYGTAPGLVNGCRATAIASNSRAEPSEHPCPKPLPWMIWAVRLGTLEGDTVVDPFMGSGTTIVACHRTRRRAIGIECERKYFDIACERMAGEAGRAPLFDPAPTIIQHGLFDAEAKS